MNLSKKLEKLREASIKGPTPIYVHSYNKGFNSACELLLPEIEKMREALIEITDIENTEMRHREHTKYCMSLNSGDCGCSYGEVIKALKQWQEFLEGE